MKTIVEVRSLTGLRGIAAMYVVVYHLFFGLAAFRPVDAFLAHGYLAVDLFFVLSGFVMAMCYGGQFAQERLVQSFPTFLVKRIGRVYPLYIFVLVIYVLFSYVGLIANRDADLLTTAVNGLMLQSILGIRSVSPPSWSISTEFFAYLLFPLALWMLRPFGFAKAAVVTLACFTVLAMIAIMPDVARTAGPLDIYNTTQIYPLLRCLAVFTLGIIVFDVSRHRLAARLGGPSSTAAVVFALLVLMCLPGTDVVVVALFCALVLTLSQSSSPIERALSSGPVHWLGLVSYSIYLDHQVLSDALKERLSTLFRTHGLPHAASLASLVILPMVIMVAGITFYAIEKPARRVFRKKARLRMTPIAADPGAP